MRRTSYLLAAASATLLLFSACSSSSKSVAASTTAKAPETTAAASTDTAAAADAPTTTSPPVVATGTHKDEPFCVTAVAFNNAPSPFNDSASTSDDFKKFFADVVTPGLAKMRASEPDAVKADVETVANAFTQLGTVFEANNWDLQKTASDTKLAAILNGQAFADATKSLDTYCGFNGS